MVAMFAIPRLPTPMATVAPGFRRAANGLEESCERTSAGMSAILWVGKFWRTIIRRGRVIRLIVTPGLAKLRTPEARNSLKAKARAFPNWPCLASLDRAAPNSTDASEERLVGRTRRGRD